MNGIARLGIVPLLAAGLAVGSGAAAQEAAAGGAAAWHIVRPGDTLEELSGRYLGDPRRWREIWQLNPGIEDPHLLLPSQRVRLVPSPAPEPPVARITGLARVVEEKPQPNPWDAARLDDLLGELDGLRTRNRSSAEMTFGDGKRLVVTEDSLVFLRRVAGRLRGVVPRDQIEIVEGQADLAARSPERRLAEVEIVVGETRVKPEPGGEGALETRARKPGAGGAQLMMYEGKGAVEAAGATVELARGTGTSVPEGGPPGPPETLLPAPALDRPAAGASLGFANPTFAFRPVPEAVAYVLEICRDPRCAALEERQTGLATPTWTPERLPVGQYYWRATAVSASGLDGYPSAALPFAITSDQLDLEPPRGEIRLAGPGFHYGEALILGPGTGLTVAAGDDASGVGAVTRLLDGREVPEAGFAHPWPPGPHRAEAVVTDRVGNQAAAAPFEFVGDSDPPAIHWHRGGAELLREYGEPDRRQRPVSGRWVRRMLKRGMVAEYSSDGRRWLPVRLPAESGSFERPGERTVATRVRAGRPQLFLRAPGGNPKGVANPLDLGAGEIVRLAVEDAVCAVAELAFGAATRPGGEVYLWAEVRDLVGNATAAEWPPAAGAAE